MTDLAISPQQQLINLILSWPATAVEYFYHRPTTANKVAGTDLIVPILSNDNPFVTSIVQRIAGSEDNDINLTVLLLERQVISRYIVITPEGSYRVRTFPVHIPTIQLSEGKVTVLKSDLYTNSILVNAALHAVNAQVKLIGLGPPILYSNITAGKYETVQITPILPSDLGTGKQFLLKVGAPWAYPHDVSVGDYQDRTMLLDRKLLRAILVQLTCQIDQLHHIVGYRGNGLTIDNFIVQQVKLETEYRGIELVAPLTVQIDNVERSSVTITTKLRTVQIMWNHKLANIKHVRYGDNIEVPQGYYSVDYRSAPSHRSWDYYTLLCSMLLIPSVHYSWLSDPDLINEFWTPLWEDQKQASEVHHLLHAAILDHLPITLETIVAILHGRLLKDNIVQAQVLRWVP